VSSTATMGTKTPNGPPRPGRAAHSPPRRPGRRRRMVTAVLALLVVAGAIAALTLAGAPTNSIPEVKGKAPTAPLALAKYDARAFLTRYLLSDGRVIRRDQGGDTVSEGQGYAMLLAVAVGNERDFNLAWQWDKSNLQLPDHLSSYHWQDGTVTGKDPATDADLDMAWALVLAATRFHQPMDRVAGLQIASAILANETVTAGGHLELVAGPWAKAVPYEVDPSYFAPEAMATLAKASGDPRWTALERDSDTLLLNLSEGKSALQLPPDWADLQVNGQIAPAGAPDTRSAPSYGLDAQRVPIWYAATCSIKQRAVSAAMWPILQDARDHGARLAYSLDGTSESKLVNPLGFVAAAAAADAAGDRAIAANLLDRADQQANRYHTYYGDAWIALGRVLLDTTLLSPCPPSPATA
jgi:endoglucanase